MKLRIARKMDRGSWKRRAHDDRDKRVWWQAYTCDQLLRAERRLRRSWRTHRTVETDDALRRWLGITPDFFAANRVESRRIRQRAIRGVAP